MPSEFTGFSDLVSMIRDDWRANGRSLVNPGLHALLIHRFGSWITTPRHSIKTILLPLYAIGFWWVRNLYGIELPHCTAVGRRLTIAHQSGIVIHPFAVIGDDCLIRQNVTIGAAGDKVEAPRLGNGVELGAGAVVIGRVKIGDGVRIGPNCVVMTDIPAGAIVVAPAPKIIPGIRVRARAV